LALRSFAQGFLINNATGCSVGLLTRKEAPKPARCKRQVLLRLWAFRASMAWAGQVGGWPLAWVGRQYLESNFYKGPWNRDNPMPIPAMPNRTLLLEIKFKDFHGFCKRHHCWVISIFYSKRYKMKNNCFLTTIEISFTKTGASFFFLIGCWWLANLWFLVFWLCKILVLIILVNPGLTQLSQWLTNPCATSLLYWLACGCVPGFSLNSHDGRAGSRLGHLAGRGVAVFTEFVGWLVYRRP
jgi:hypothetical protein